MEKDAKGFADAVRRLLRVSKRDLEEQERIEQAEKRLTEKKPA